MSYAIELNFDAVGEALVLALWREVAALGATSMIGSDSRPHISLAVAESVETRAVAGLLDQFANGTKAFPLSLASLGIFPGAEPVLFLAPKVTAELLQMQRAFLVKFDPLAKNIWPYYLPDGWVPHCTLTMGIRPEALGAAYKICGAAVKPLEVRVVGISLIEFHPVRKLHDAALAG
jgi:hypothetical protein